MENINCIAFPPAVDDKCTLLILGSMPGVASLNAQQYYAHPQNRFWKMMAKILINKNEAPTSYEERIHMLLSHHIALWDSIATCEREGSLDSAIKNEQGNDFTTFLKKYPNIKTICFNGGKAFASFKRYNKELLKRKDITFHQMPSTSPANARWRLPMLIETWQKVLCNNIE